MTSEQREEFVKTCPKKVYILNQQTKKVEIEKEPECTLCNECVRYSQKLGDGFERAV
jgi:NAD-dependent dihydropyrimidine dehydrogenase PreA subunit